MNAIGKLSPSMLAVLAVGGLWWLTQWRTVSATGNRTNPAYGTEAALRNRAVQAYNVRPSGTTPVLSSDPVGALIAAGARLFSGGASVSPVALQRTGSTNNPSYVAAGEVIRAPGYEPGFVPNTQGELEAQAYVLQNPDLFVSNPPPTYTYNPGIDPNSGYLDNQ